MDQDRLEEAAGLDARAVDFVMATLGLLPATIAVCTDHGSVALQIADNLTVVYGERGCLHDPLGRQLVDAAVRPWMVLWVQAGTDPQGEPRTMLAGVVDDPADVERALVDLLDPDVAGQLVERFRAARVSP